MIASNAQQKCERWSSDFATLFRQQFVLSRQSNLSYPGFHTQHLQGWTLYFGEALQTVRVLDATGTHVGFLMGLALLDGQLATGDLVLEVAETDPSFQQGLTDLVNRMGGRFALIILGAQFQKIYCDPVCDFPVVFDPARQIAGSSLGLILHRPFRRNPMFNLAKILRGGRTFTLQHTADAGVFRALPNHALDLISFQSERHWPDQSFRFNDTEADPEEIVDQIIHRLGQNFGAIVSNLPCIVPMTGGRDSRSLIACGADHLHHVDEFSAFKFHNSSSIDAVRGREIIKSLGYDFKIYGRKPISHRARAEFHLKTGYTGVRGEIAGMRAVESYPKDHVVVRGNIMELLRANQWRQRHIDNPFVRAHAMMRLKADVPISPYFKTFKRDYRTWRIALPTSDLRERPYDMAFLEFLVPNTQGPYFNGYHNNVFVNPFNDRYLIGRSMQLPVQLRYDDKIHDMILERTRPELMAFPYH